MTKATHGTWRSIDTAPANEPVILRGAHVRHTPNGVAMSPGNLIRGDNGAYSANLQTMFGHPAETQQKKPNK